jgi:hypothetical protein
VLRGCSLRARSACSSTCHPSALSALLCCLSASPYIHMISALCSARSALSLTLALCAPSLGALAHTFSVCELVCDVFFDLGDHTLPCTRHRFGVGAAARVYGMYRENGRRCAGSDKFSTESGTHMYSLPHKLPGGPLAVALLGRGCLAFMLPCMHTSCGRLMTSRAG